MCVVCVCVCVCVYVCICMLPPLPRPPPLGLFAENPSWLSSGLPRACSWREFSSETCAFRRLDFFFSPKLSARAERDFSEPRLHPGLGLRGAGGRVRRRSPARLPSPSLCREEMNRVVIFQTCQPPATSCLAADRSGSGRRPGSLSWRAAPTPQSAAASPFPFLPLILKNLLAFRIFTPPPRFVASLFHLSKKYSMVYLVLWG